MFKMIGRVESHLRSGGMLMIAVILSGIAVSPTLAQWHRRLPEISVWVEKGVGAAKTVNKASESREQRDEREREQKRNTAQREQEAIRQKYEAKAKAAREAKIAEGQKYLNAGLQSLKHNDHVTALTLFRRALTFFVEAEDRENAMLASFQVGYSLALNGHFEESVSVLQPVLAYYNERNEPAKTSLVAWFIGLVYRDLKQNDKALEYLQIARETAYLNPENKEHLSNVLYHMALTHKDQGNTPVAIKLLTTTLEITVETKNMKLGCDVFSILADLYLQQGNLIAAEQLLLSLLELTKESDPRQHTVTLIRLGQIGLQQRDYNKATVRFNQALQMSEEQSDVLNKANAHHQLGIVYLEKGKRDQAKSHLDEALAIYLQLNNEEGINRVKASLEKVASLPETVARTTDPTTVTPPTNKPSRGKSVRPTIRRRLPRLKPTVVGLR